MILADTSVWVDHLRSGNSALAEGLMEGRILVHPMIVAELALGTLKARGEVLGLLDDLPTPVIASPQELRHFIEAHRLYGRGVGYVDVHLLAACRLTPGTVLWSYDKRLARAASQLGIGKS